MQNDYCSRSDFDFSWTVRRKFVLNRSSTELRDLLPTAETAGQILLGARRTEQVEPERNANRREIARQTKNTGGGRGVKIQWYTPTHSNSNTFTNVHEIAARFDVFYDII